MNFLITIMFCMFSMMVFAEAQKPYDPATQRPRTPEERILRKQWVEKRKYQYLGGDLVVPNSQKGQITIVDCQATVSSEILDEAIAYLIKETKFKIVREKGTFSGISPKVIGDVSLYVIEDSKLPTMLVAPENKWAILNIYTLKTGRGSQPQFLKARVLKEMSRTFAALCGGISSNFPDSLTTGIYNLNQLDRQEDNRLSVDVIARFAPTLANIGITPAEISNYRAACKQGWAPAPTNDVQKAIWNEINATPKNPMKIEFDPKKGR